MQSSEGKQILKKFQLEEGFSDSMVLIRGGKAWTESAAALHLAAALGGFWLLACFFWIVPAFIRNWFYRKIARNRYRIWGKNDQCYLPDPD